MIIKPWTPKPNILFEYKKFKSIPNDLITVCITNYNYERFIIECLDSVFHQTYKNLELIVIDDISSDNSISTIRNWMKLNKKRFYKCSFIQNKTNQGPSNSRNIVFDMSISNYIFILDADNSIYPKAIEKLFRCIGDYAGAYSQIEIFGNQKGIGYADVWDEDRLKESNYIDVMSLVKKDAWLLVDGFSHIDEGWEDYDFWLKFRDKKLEMIFLPEILCRYRIHGNSRTNNEASSAHQDLELIMKFRHPE